MKTKLMAALLATCFAAPAFAQTPAAGSSIVIYGIADAGVMVSSNGDGTKTRIASGIADGSRIGFRGTEDLGNGWKAIFNLEARVEIDTGGNTPGLISNAQGQFLTNGMEASFRAGGPSLTAIGNAILPGLKAALQPAIAVNSNRAIFDRTAMVGLITPVGAVLMGRMYTPGYEVFNMADAFE
ncbi:MAG TPA: porin, partial [Burkholderiaceae bacterium]